MFPRGQAQMPILPIKLQKPKSKVSFLNASLEASTKYISDVEVQSQQTKPSSLSTSSTPRSPVGRHPRTPRKVGAQATRLEAIDDSLGPLGPLGESSNIPEPELPPAPPSKEQSLPIRNARSIPSSQSHMGRSMVDSSDLGDDDRNLMASRQRQSPQGQAFPSNENQKRQTHPSVSIEQAARPSFDITVGDPHKVGDLTSSHIVYQVRTKVRVVLLLRMEMRNVWLTATRHPQKLISSPSLPSVVDTEISYGSTIRYIAAIRE